MHVSKGYDIIYIFANIIEVFKMLSGNPRLFNCRDESAKRFSVEFENQEDVECVFDIFLLFLYVYGILCV